MAIRYLLFYLNEPSIVVGKHQNLFQEFNIEYTQKNGIHLVRRISGGRAVYHDDGTLLFDSDLYALTKSLDSILDVFKSKGIQSINSDVTNIAEGLPHPMDMATFRKKLIESISAAFGDLKVGQLTGADWDRIYQLCENKYKSWDWTFGRSPDFSVRHKFKCDGEDFEGAVHVSGGVITKIDMGNGSGGQAGRGYLQSKLIGERYVPQMACIPK